MPARTRQSPENTRPALILWGAWAGLLGLTIAAAGSLGGSLDPVTALLLTIDTHVRSGWPALLFLAASVGLGRSLAFAAPVRVRPALRGTAPAAGLAILLGTVWCLGTAGALGAVPLLIPIVLGIVALVAGSGGVRTVRSVPAPPGWLWVGLPGLAVLLVAAASPPGVLWASEYAGYDTLSYHLQLPKEWVTLGHTRPLSHNTYSFLPGAIEQAYAALGSLAGGASDGLLANGAWRLQAAHTLHAGLAVLGAVMVARLARRLALASGANRSGVRTASAIGGGLVLCTPWTVVVGSMAYNEMGVIVLGAGALLAACRRGVADEDVRTAVARAAAVGALVGAACLCKPTALLFVGIPAGVMLLRFGRLRHWGTLAVSGSIAGLLVIAPWMIRNAVMTGNPVFPLATGVLGSGHWTTEQATRFAAAHAFDGGLLDRLTMLVFADPNAGDGAAGVARYRGTTNVQWLLAFPAALAGLIVLAFGRRSRAVGVGLALCLAGQVVAWLAFTHLQSRFLIPCLLVLGPIVGVACARFGRNGLIAGAALCLLQAGALWTVFAEQRGGTPNALLGAPPAVFMGEPYAPEIGRASPIAYLNHEVRADAVVLLVGDATPLYLARETVYATAWERPPVLDLAAGLVHADLVLINNAELSRLRASGYLHEDLTPERLAQLVSAWRLVRAWPELGVRLYRVPTDGGEQP